MDAKIIPIFSNKGGVGKTFIAINLSTALALAKKKVLLIDLDLQAGQDVAINLNMTPEKSLADMIKDGNCKPGMTIEEIQKYVTPHSSGFDFLTAATDPQQISHLRPQDIKNFVVSARDHYDFIIADIGVSFSQTAISILDSADTVLLVATPDVLSVYQVAWSIKVLQEMHFPTKFVRLILNRAESQGGVSWKEVRDALNVDLIGRIPSDGKLVGKAITAGMPVVLDSPRSPVADSFKKIVPELNKKDLYMPRADHKDIKTQSDQIEALAAQDAMVEFSEEGEGTAAPPAKEDIFKSEEFTKEKIRLQKLLIERLDMDSLTPDSFSNPKKAEELRASAKQIISNILIEQGGKFAATLEMRSRTVDEIVKETFGLGILEEIMDDPLVGEVMINGSQEIYVEVKGDLLLTDHKFISNQHLRAIINRIIAPLGRRLDESSPMVDARLQDGSRFNAIVPPVCLSGPCVTIRKFAAEKLTVNHVVDKYKSLSPAMRDFLHACVIGRMNIIIAGGTGSGKTTLLNVLSEFIPDGERIITIEEAAELSLQKEHWARLESRPANVEGAGEITVRDLFVNTLRMRPDRIVIGECRGPEVLDMLQAMNTGHDGSMTSLHANSARDVLIRMSSMILLSGIELPMRAINEMISSAINVIVHMARYTDGSRKVTGISEIVGLNEEGELELREIFHFDQTARSAEGTIEGFYRPLGQAPNVAEELIKKGVKLNLGLFTSEPSPGY
ncbi:MAG: Flp pilus assembly complex ATPase component TadA [Candidatus Omnitrophica bacterium]|nr:Flp pilus assembly complex ATPase component TadA [Candidatus Omnitrophota bacterium]MCB9722214.1 Flp pilus assembly complex ATPase component TadA [Candidatus Omnitrophota bacterium]